MVYDRPKIKPRVTYSMVLMEGLLFATLRITSYITNAATTRKTVLTEFMENALDSPIAVTKTIIIEIILSIFFIYQTLSFDMRAYNTLFCILL